jgi:hypothetical protein
MRIQLKNVEPGVAAICYLFYTFLLVYHCHVRWQGDVRLLMIQSYNQSTSNKKQEGHVLYCPESVSGSIAILQYIVLSGRYCNILY